MIKKWLLDWLKTTLKIFAQMLGLAMLAVVLGVTAAAILLSVMSHMSQSNYPVGTGPFETPGSMAAPWPDTTSLRT